MQTKTLMTPEQAGEVTRLLLEFESINRMRELVNRLVLLQVDVAAFHEWTTTAPRVSQSLTVDVHNLLSHIEKGIEVKSDRLHQMSDSMIKKEVKKTIASYRFKRDLS